MCVQSVDMLITQKGIQSMKKEMQEPDYDELRKEREIQKGIEKQEAELASKLLDGMTELIEELFEEELKDTSNAKG